jgi:hypothetical protein
MADLYRLERELGQGGMTTADRLHQMYDVSANGQRFVMTRVAGAGSGNEVQLMVVENVFEELTRLVPP